MGPSWCIAIWDPCSLAQIPGSNNCWSRPHQVSEADPRPPHHHCMFRVHPAKYLVPSETQNSWLMELCSQNMPKKNVLSTDWLKGTFTGKPYLSWENRWSFLQILSLKPIHCFWPIWCPAENGEWASPMDQFFEGKGWPIQFFSGVPQSQTKKYVYIFLSLYIYIEIYIYIDV